MNRSRTGSWDKEPTAQQYQVTLSNEQSEHVIDTSQLKQAVELVLSDSPYATGEVHVVVVDDPTIHALNRQFLNHDYPTDVLSFVMEETEVSLEGEIIVSADTAAASAKDYNWTRADELLLYVIHGTLHLVGYRDKTPDEVVEMRTAEKRFLTKLGITIPKPS